jgi:ATP-dependent DNA ligase
MHAAGKTSDRSQGYALRFPRFIQLVQDKEPDQGTTTDEIERLYNTQII